MKKYKILYILFASMVLLFHSCYNYKNTGLLQEKGRDLPVYESMDYLEYKIKINDELIFTMISTDETIFPVINSSNSASSGNQNGISYRVFPDGTIDLPFLKEIPVAGLTILEATKKIEERYRELIPNLTLKVALANKTFTVIGEGGTGVFNIIRDRLTIYQALAISGSIRDEADFQKVKIIRETEKGTKVLEFDIRPATVIHSQYYYVYPNDIIYLQKSKSSFYKVKNYPAFLGVVSTSMTLFFTVLSYFNQN